MPARLHPGVYVEEVPSAARSIEAAGTSTAIFVGETERGPLGPTRITGRAEYERLFGGYRRHASVGAQIASVTYAIDAFFRNGGSAAYVLRALDKDAATAELSVPTGQKVVASSPGAWGNRVSAVFCTSSAGASRFRIVVLYKAPGTNEARIVEAWDRLSVEPGDENYVVDILNRSLFLRWGSGTPTPIPAVFLKSLTKDEDIIAEFANFDLQGGTHGETDLDVVSFPTLLSRLDEVHDASLLVVPARTYESDANNLELGKVALSYAESRPHQDLFCIVDMPRQTLAVTADDATNATVASFGGLTPKTNMGAVYFPWVEVGDPAGVGREPTLLMPPSGFVAGVYARTDSRRGVWKAPAGLDATLLGVRKLQQKLLDSHQDVLNPLGVNALRVQPAAGAVVWGARSMRPDSEWRYVPVRRMAIFLRKSIYNSIQWAVFEPNDENLWSSLRFSIGGFMEQLLRQGAFAGKTTREAFFVKCDAETTPEADQIAGIVNVWVGFAPLRPAEFVVVKLSQMVNQKS